MDEYDDDMPGSDPGGYGDDTPKRSPCHPTGVLAQQRLRQTVRCRIHTIEWSSTGRRATNSDLTAITMMLRTMRANDTPRAPKTSSPSNPIDPGLPHTAEWSGLTCFGCHALASCPGLMYAALRYEVLCRELTIALTGTWRHKLPARLNPPGQSPACLVQSRRFLVLSSIATGNFTDTRFFVPARHSQSGNVTGLLPLYVNSMMFRRASDEFDKMLSGGFCESVSASFAAEPTFGKLEVPIDEYGYESDSDLGDAEDEPSNDETTKHAAPSAVQDSSTEEDDQRARNIIDSSGETTANREKNQQAVQTAQSVKVDAASGSAQRSPSGCIGRTVFVKDMAYKTWVALIAYLYTGQIKFSPLQSRAISLPNQPNTSNDDTSYFEMNQCSPKSMYRLADKYGLDSLKSQALEKIRSELVPDNILKELFSTFTSRYPEIQQLQVDFLCDHIHTSDAMATMPEWIAMIAQGHLPHSQHVVSTLLLNMASKIPKPFSTVSDKRPVAPLPKRK